MKIGNLQASPWYVRLGVFAGVALVAYGSFWYFVTRGTRAQTKELSQQIAELRPRNAQAQIASQRLNEFKAAYKAKQEEYEELKALLPEQRELTMVLQGVQDRARTNGLSVRRFTPREDLQQDFYSGKRIEVGVTSSFSGLRSFFENLAHYQRIVSITNFEIKQLDSQTPEKTVEARFDLTAYYVSAEKLQTASHPPEKASGQAPTSTTAAAPAK
jgi:type IV pilus assembly protein PilO